MEVVAALPTVAESAEGAGVARMVVAVGSRAFPPALIAATGADAILKSAQILGVVPSAGISDLSSNDPGAFDAPLFEYNAKRPSPYSSHPRADVFLQAATELRAVTSLGLTEGTVRDLDARAQKAVAGLSSDTRVGQNRLEDAASLVFAALAVRHAMSVKGATPQERITDARKVLGNSKMVEEINQALSAQDPLVVATALGELLTVAQSVSGANGIDISTGGHPLDAANLPKLPSTTASNTLDRKPVGVITTASPNPPPVLETAYTFPSRVVDDHQTASPGVLGYPASSPVAQGNVMQKIMTPEEADAEKQRREAHSLELLAEAETKVGDGANLRGVGTGRALAVETLAAVLTDYIDPSAGHPRATQVRALAATALAGLRDGPPLSINVDDPQELAAVLHDLSAVMVTNGSVDEMGLLSDQAVPGTHGMIDPIASLAETIALGIVRGSNLTQQMRADLSRTLGSYHANMREGVAHLRNFLWLPHRTGLADAAFRRDEAERLGHPLTKEESDALRDQSLLPPNTEHASYVSNRVVQYRERMEQNQRTAVENAIEHSTTAWHKLGISSGQSPSRWRRIVSSLFRD